MLRVELPDALLELPSTLLGTLVLIHICTVSVSLMLRERALMPICWAVSVIPRRETRGSDRILRQRACVELRLVPVNDVELSAVVLFHVHKYLEVLDDWTRQLQRFCVCEQVLEDLALVGKTVMGGSGRAFVDGFRRDLVDVELRRLFVYFHLR